MQSSKIDFVIQKPITSHSYEPCVDKFSYQPKLGWDWLQKKIFWFLRKIKAFATNQISTVTYDRITIDKQKFVERIWAQYNSLMCHYNLCGERLLIGPEDYSKLMCETPLYNLNGPLSFDTEYWISKGSSEKTVCGMKVTIIPWMTGMVVLPKDLD